MGRESTAAKRRREAERARCVKKSKILDEHCTVIHNISAKGHFTTVERHLAPKSVDEVTLDEFERLSLAASIDEGSSALEENQEEPQEEESTTQVSLSHIILPKSQIDVLKCRPEKQSMRS
jgi:hypothetical protein